jgi:hypothetical protein
MAVWAAFGPYEDAHAAAEGLLRAPRSVFGHEELKRQEEWTQGHIANYHEWETAGTFTSGERMMRSAFISNAHGTAFNEAYTRAREDLMKEIEDGMAWMNKEFLEDTGHKMESIRRDDGSVNFQYKQIWSDEQVRAKKQEVAENVFRGVGERLMADESAEARALCEFLVEVCQANTGTEPQTSLELGRAWANCLNWATDNPEEAVAQEFRALNDAWQPTTADGDDDA